MVHGDANFHSVKLLPSIPRCHHMTAAARNRSHFSVLDFSPKVQSIYIYHLYNSSLSQISASYLFIYLFLCFVMRSVIVSRSRFIQRHIPTNPQRCLHLIQPTSAGRLFIRCRFYLLFMTIYSALSLRSLLPHYHLFWYSL